MKKTITYQRVNPAGNITAFVFTPTPAKERVAIGRALMEQIDPSVEQVGFISLNDRREPVRLDMMGGEFCGNASRALGLLQAIAKKKEGNVIEEVCVSGVSHPLTVHLDTQNAYAKIALQRRFLRFRKLCCRRGQKRCMASTRKTGALTTTARRD